MTHAIPKAQFDPRLDRHKEAATDWRWVMEREDTETEQQWNREQTIPERIWVCKRWYQRYDGMEHVESVCDDESLLQGYRDHGYTITKYVKAEPCE